MYNNDCIQRLKWISYKADRYFIWWIAPHALSIQANSQMLIIRESSTLPRQQPWPMLLLVTTRPTPIFISCWKMVIFFKYRNAIKGFVLSKLENKTKQTKNPYAVSLILMCTTYTEDFIFEAVFRIHIWCFYTMPGYSLGIFYVYFQRQFLWERHRCSGCVHRYQSPHLKLHGLYHRSSILRYVSMQSINKALLDWLHGGDILILVVPELHAIYVTTCHISSLPYQTNKKLRIEVPGI